MSKIILLNGAGSSGKTSIARAIQLAIMQEREFLRRDRVIGLSNDQFDRVHSGTREYDLTVDTSNSSAFSCAREIMDFIDSNQIPQGFNNMRNLSQC